MLAASCSAADAMRLPFPVAEARRVPPRAGLAPLTTTVPPSLLDRGDRGLGGARHFDGERRLELALGQEPHAIAQPPQQAGGDERRAIDGEIGLQPAGVKRRPAAGRD